MYCFSKTLFFIIPNRLLSNSWLGINNSAVVRRSFARRAVPPPPRESAREQQRQDFEDVLNEKQSEKLYGLSSLTSNLQLFAQQLEQGSLNLFPEYQRSYVWKPDFATDSCHPLLCTKKKRGCLMWWTASNGWRASSASTSIEKTLRKSKTLPFGPRWKPSCRI